MRVEKLKAAFEIETVLVHFPLHPETPLEGREMASFYRQRGIDPEASYQRMKKLMDEEGLPYGRRTHTYNSRLAQELGKWADTQPGGEAIHDKLYKAYFVEGRNIGDPDILVEIAVSVGLPAEEARAVLTERRFQEAVDADWQQSHQYGVTGVPTFVADRYGVVGAQPYSVLEQLIAKAGAVRRDQTGGLDQRKTAGGIPSRTCPQVS